MKKNFVYFFFILVSVGHMPGITVNAYADDGLTIIKIPRKFEDPCSKPNQNRIHQQYYDNGALYVQTECRDGQPHGMSRQYYDNGQVLNEAQYNQGKLDGILKGIRARWDVA